ncbi:MAG: ABC transporter ATP-binding protein [Planctomycetaceae bacterium]|nr:ABC transporter ATP-binding protein [Planctomycetaceae bacterium]
MSTAVVEIDNVTKTFDSLTAVNAVSLKLHQGQTLGLIGPNGAGKTTLLRMVCSLAKPDSGDIRIQGDSVRSNPLGVRSRLGFMPAEFGSPRNLNILEYLDYFGCLYAIPRQARRQRIAEVCELTDLTGREDVMVKGLSTGNKQRLLLAKTLLHDPELLVLDEPASGLDPRARTELRVIVKALASLGKTIIISSHILPDIEDISDRIGIMEAGSLVLDGDLTELREGSGTAGNIVKIKVEDESTSVAMDLLKGLADVQSCENRDGTLVVSTQQPNGNFVLAEMLRHDIRVVQFAEDAPNLEEIFMRSTAGKVT